MTEPNKNQALQLFKFEDNEVRTCLRDDQPWFVAADVCKILAHTNVTVALKRLDDDEKAAATLNTIKGKNSSTLNSSYPPEAQKMVNIVNESGLYNLILTSRKPEAKTFRKWITSEVIPAIRKTGQYVDPSAMNALLANEPLTPAQALQIRQTINRRLKPNFKAAGGAYLYQKLRNQFEVKFYTEIRRGDFAAALELVRTANPAELLVEAPALSAANS